VADKNYVSRAVEAAIHVGLVILLLAACYVILRPFISLIAWGIILAVALYPRYRKLQIALGGRDALSATLITILLLIALILPTGLLAGRLVHAIQGVTTHLKGGHLIIPPPPPRLESWPIIGARLTGAWNKFSTNTSAALTTFAPQIRTVASTLISASAKIGVTVLQFALSIVIAGILLAHSQGSCKIVHLLTGRIWGDESGEFEQIAASTIRSVTTGILGVALIQTVLAGVGFFVARMPGASLWTIVFLVAAVLQVGAIVLIPAVIYMFMIASATKAALFLIWCVIVGVSDNALKPLLLGRGVAVPIVVVFLGAIGGFIAIGILGLFIVLSVGYKVFLAWLAATRESREVYL